MNQPILITGATGTIGRRVTELLRDEGVTVRAASRHPSGPDAVAFDFTNRSTWDAAFDGVGTAFLVRPPDLGNVRRDMIPALERARSLGVRRMVLLSVQGADSVPVLPHAVVERWLQGSGLRWTFLRPAYFDQNLTGVLAPDVRRGVLQLPSGRSRMAFIDGHDVAAVAARVLLDPERFDGQALTLTSDEAPSWEEVAQVLSDVLGRPVCYRSVGPASWFRHARRDLGMEAPMAVVSGIIHASARLGRSTQCTDAVERVLGRAPVGLRAFVERERDFWG